ncbi:hypothetical protein [Oryzobacter telluris]|uniref:hypothetical protein n=1 Tax=Oryzobacter telluris TaxID=3149179 RepID=UPI00370D3FD4
MRLISAVLGFVLRKLGVLMATVLAMFLVYLLLQVVAPPLRQAVADRDRLERVSSERATLEADLARLTREVEGSRQATIERIGARVNAEIESGRRTVADKASEIDRLRAERDDVCGFWSKVGDLLTRANVCEKAEVAVRKADEALDTLEANLERAKEDAAVIGDSGLTVQQKLDRLGEGADQSLERDIANKESELSQKKAEEVSLQEARRSGAGWVVEQWSRSWRWLAGIALLVMLMPPVLRTVSYFLLMPIVKRLQKPLNLVSGFEHTTASLRNTLAQRTMTVDLGAGEVLSARSEHVRPVQGRIRSRLLYDWTSPFISFSAGLYGLSRVTGEEGALTSATLATPNDPNSYLMRIDFENHPGVVMRPRHIVGVIGSPSLETTWRWGVQALARWQVRYISFAGSGSLIVQGSGDVVATNPRGGTTKIEQNLMMGFDSRLAVTVNRTEVFWPYLWGRTPLVDDEFSGDEPLFWQKSTDDGPRNPVAKTFDALFSGLGKVLGF